MKPNTIEEAHDLGYDAGRDTSGMTGYYQSWPTDADMEKPDAFVKAYTKGFFEGHDDRPESVSSWAYDEEPQRSDAAPGL